MIIGTISLTVNFEDTILVILVLIMLLLIDRDACVLRKILKQLNNYI
jgi:hypothetical protein